MEKKIKVLLVEDDKKFSESLRRILTEEGFECIVAEKPQTALSLIKTHNFEVALVDCMLPQMNGIDLALKIKETAGDSIVLYLMSGIYKDKNFSVNAIKKTGAHSFLIKPFNAGDLIQMINDAFKDITNEISIKTKSIKGLFLQEHLSQSLILNIINNNPIINGNELPFIFSALMAYKCLGSMRLSRGQESIELYFHELQVSANTGNSNPQRLKTALISGGWMLPEDLDALAATAVSPLRLLELNLVSPHACIQVEKDFFFQQLAKFFVNDSIHVKFSLSRSDQKNLRFDYSEIENQLYNYTMNTDVNWLKAFYLGHMGTQIRKMSMSHNKTQFFPVVSANKNAIALMMKNQSATDFMVESKLSDDENFQLLHVMLVFREFYLGDEQADINYESQKERLRKLQASLEHQNAFERLGLTEKSSDQEMKRSYQEMSQNLHPDRLVNAPQDVRTLSLLVYEKIQEAYNQIKTPEKRELYLKKMESRRKENLQKADLFFDRAITTLSRGDVSEAERILSDAQTLAPYSPRYKLLLGWLHVKTKQTPIAQITRTLQSLPQDEKETPIYLYVRGLLYLGTNENDKATSLFKSALNKDSNFMPARRELTVLTQDDKKANVNGNILNADLKDVVGLFFNRKKK